jgi:hypothetical protein
MNQAIIRVNELRNASADEGWRGIILLIDMRNDLLADSDRQLFGTFIFPSISPVHVASSPCHSHDIQYDQLTIFPSLPSRYLSLQAQTNLEKCVWAVMHKSRGVFQILGCGWGWFWGGVLGRMA